MNIENLIRLFQRDLNRLIKELESYEDEVSLWLQPEGITNTAGNLSLHLVGNLKHFIGAQLGNTGFVRNREAEFNFKNVPRSEMLEEIQETIAVVSETLGKMQEEELNKVYPIVVMKSIENMTTGLFLIHLYGHLNYHLGQISYHRRLTGS